MGMRSVMIAALVAVAGSMSAGAASFHKPAFFLSAATNRSGIPKIAAVSNDTVQVMPVLQAANIRLAAEKKALTNEIEKLKSDEFLLKAELMKAYKDKANAVNDMRLMTQEIRDRQNQMRANIAGFVQIVNGLRATNQLMLAIITDQQSELQEAEEAASSRGEVLLNDEAAREAREKAEAAAKTKAREAEVAMRSAKDKADLTSEAKAALVKLQKRMAAQKADLEAQAAKNAEQQAKDEIEAKHAAENKPLEAGIAAENERARRNALAQGEAAKKAADQKLFEEAKAKYLAQEKAAIEVKIQAMAKQETENKARVTQAEQEQKAAETKAAALAFESKMAQVNAAAAVVSEKRAKQNAAKDAKAKRGTEVKSAGGAQEQTTARDFLSKKETALQRDKNLHYNRGVLYQENHQWFSAIWAYKKAIEINPDDADAHYNLAYLYESVYHDRVNATMHYRRYLAIRPDSEDAVQVEQKINSLNIEQGIWGHPGETIIDEKLGRW